MDSNDGNSMGYDFLDIMFQEGSTSHDNHNLSSSHSTSSNSLNLHNANNGNYDMIGDLHFQQQAQQQHPMHIQPQSHGLQHQPSPMQFNDHRPLQKLSPLPSSHPNNSLSSFPAQGKSDLSNLTPFSCFKLDFLCS